MAFVNIMWDFQLAISKQHQVQPFLKVYSEKKNYLK